MSLHRRAAKRDGNESDIIAALKRVGVGVQPLSAEGVPDLLCVFRNRLHLIEVKMPGEKLTPAQEAWHRSWPGPVSVVRSVEEALSVVGLMPCPANGGAGEEGEA